MVRNRGRWSMVALVTSVCVGLIALLPPAPARLRYADQHRYRRVPVVLVVFDELPLASLMTPDGEIDGATFPNFARLAQSSTWFKNATADHYLTQDAVPAILTGRRGPHRAVEPRNLFTLLGGSYAIRSPDPVPGFCPRDACPSSGGRPVAMRNLGFFPRGGRGRSFARFVGQIARRPRAAFYFLHTVMPHSTWRFLPTGQVYPESEPEPGEIDNPGPGRRWSNDDWLVTQVYQRHLLQLRLVDRALGRLLTRLQAAELFERSLLIVTADHGMSFIPGEPKRVPTTANVGGVGRVPLFVKTPGQRAPAESTRPARSIDLVPTIADLLDLDRRWGGLEGRSLFAPAGPNPARRLGGVPLSADLDDLGTVIGRRETWFERSSHGALDLYGVRPAGSPRWIGLPVADLPVGTTAATAEIAHLERHVAAQPDEDVFPALLEGSVSGAATRSTIAIAINGRIAALTRTYPTRDGERFYAMLAPRYFTTAGNTIDLYVVDPVTSTLSPLT